MLSTPVANRFHATRWSLILTATGRDAGARRQVALEELAAIYWPPLYAYLRREGHVPDRAEDLTQEFFARLLEKHALQDIHPSKGKFRSFLLASLKHFLANEWDKARAEKRGGKVRTFSLSDAESRYFPATLNLADASRAARTAEQLFNQRWALTLLGTVVTRLRAEYERRGHLPLFESLQATLTGELPETYTTLAKRLKTTEGALQVAAHRLRKRYRELLRNEIAQTVADPALIDEEMNDLLNSL